MRLQIGWALLIFTLIFISTIESRRIRVRTRPQEIDEEEAAPQQLYYTTDPREDGGRALVLVSTDDYNGLYGQPQPSAPARIPHSNYVASSRASHPTPKPARTKEVAKEPPVQTIRNYNKVNDDGSFTFGYEAADGSFKEETRGTDCVVRGKYGYIDPDGNKREFTYVSGNPCDPNAPKDSEEQEHEQEKEDDGPANYPKQFPARTVRPVPQPTKPPVTLFQNTYDQDEDVEQDEEPLQVLRPIQPVRTRVLPQRPAIQYVQQPQPQPQPQPTLQPKRVVHIPQTRPTVPTSVVYRQTNAPVSITPRPTIARAQLPATTYRPQLQVSVTPRPNGLFTKEVHSSSPAVFPSSTPSSISPTRTTAGDIDFNAEFQRFAIDNNIISSTPSTAHLKTTQRAKTVSPIPSSDPIYSSELVFDPSSGQYKTALYQTLPQTDGEFSLSHRIQPYVATHQPSRFLNYQPIQPSQLYRQVQAQPQPQPQPQQIRPSQHFYHQQQADLQFQNSQQLFAQQQKARAAAQTPHSAQSAAPQQFYFIQPSVATQQQQLAAGQIDAFLRGHNIQY